MSELRAFALEKGWEPDDTAALLMTGSAELIGVNAKAAEINRFVDTFSRLIDLQRKNKERPLA